MLKELNPIAMFVEYYLNSGGAEYYQLTDWTQVHITGDNIDMILPVDKQAVKIGKIINGLVRGKKRIGNG